MKQSLGLEIKFDNITDQTRQLTRAQVIGQHALGIEEPMSLTRIDAENGLEIHPVARDLFEDEGVISVGMSDREVRVFHQSHTSAIEARILRGMVAAGYSFFSNPQS